MTDKDKKAAEQEETAPEKMVKVKVSSGIPDLEVERIRMEVMVEVPEARGMFKTGEVRLERIEEMDLAESEYEALCNLHGKVVRNGVIGALAQIERGHVVALDISDLDRINPAELAKLLHLEELTMNEKSTCSRLPEINWQGALKILIAKGKLRKVVIVDEKGGKTETPIPRK